MTVNVQHYTPPKEAIDEFLSYMNHLAMDIMKNTECPEGAASMAAIAVIRGFLDAAESEIPTLKPEEAKPH